MFKSNICFFKQSIRQIVEDIVALEKSDIKLALVEYRDHPPQDETFVTRVHDFTESVKEMKKWLENCKAEGGEPYFYFRIDLIEFFMYLCIYKIIIKLSKVATCPKQLLMAYMMLLS